jgi:hypothetical protein
MRLEPRIEEEAYYIIRSLTSLLVAEHSGTSQDCFPQGYGRKRQAARVCILVPDYTRVKSESGCTLAVSRAFTDCHMSTNRDPPSIKPSRQPLQRKTFTHSLACISRGPTEPEVHRQPLVTTLHQERLSTNAAVYQQRRTRLGSFFTILFA